MALRSSRVLLALLTIPLAAAPEAAAQWAITVGVAAPRFWGGSREPGGSRSFRPYRPTILGAGFERSWRGGGIGVGAYHSSTSLALEGPDAAVIAKNALELSGVMAEVSLGIGAIGQTVRLMVSAGSLVEVWHLAGGPSHTRAGLAASLGAQVEMGGRWSGAIGVGAAVTASPFSKNDLDVGFRPSALWRREVSGRLRFRL